MSNKHSGLSLLAAASLIITSGCFLLNELASIDLWLLMLVSLSSYAIIVWRKLPMQCYFLATVTLIAAIFLFLNGGFTQEALKAGAYRSAFYVLFITTFVLMGMVARTSQQIKRCSEVILTQPPSRRYAVLTFSSHLLSPLLSIGTGNLMGTIVAMAAKPGANNPDLVIADIRRKRMATAVMRGMTSITLWSPTTIIIGVLLATTPGLSWRDIAVPGLLAAFTLMTAGWLLDWFTRPKHITSLQPSASGGIKSLSSFLPLLFLVLLILVGSMVLEHLLGIRQIIALLVCVIICSFAWLMLQGGSFKNAFPHLSYRLKSEFVPTFTNPAPEVVIVTFAGLLGVLVSLQVSPTLLADIVDWLGFEEAGTLIAISILVLITANMGITPLITIALAAESIWLIPGMQFDNQAVVLCFTGTWISYTMTSPMSLQVRLLAKAIDVEAFRLGILWNGAFSLCFLLVLYTCIIALS